MAPAMLHHLAAELPPAVHVRFRPNQRWAIFGLRVPLALAFAGTVGGCCLNIVDNGTGPGASSSARGTGGSSSSGSTSTGGTSGGSGGSDSASSTTTGAGLLWLGSILSVDVAALDGSGTAPAAQYCLAGGLGDAGPIPGKDGGPTFVNVANLAPGIVDTEGNLWTLLTELPGGNTWWITFFTPEQVSQRCSGTPVELAEVDPPLGGPPRMAFDAQGYLWVLEGREMQAWMRGSASTGSRNQRTRRTRLLAARSPTAPRPRCPARSPTWRWTPPATFGWRPRKSPSPSRRRHSPPTAARGPGPGDLFLTTPAALQAWNISLDGGTHAVVDNRYDYLAFDSAGDLWVIASSLDQRRDVQLLEFTQAQLEDLARNPTPTPPVAVPLPSNSLLSDAGLPGPLAFDSAGNLWLYGYPAFQTLGEEADAGILLRFAAGTEASDRPDRVFVRPGPWPSLAFSPIPSGLPIRP